MGQYYKPIFLNKENKPMNHFTCYDFASGAKLMEHSWMKNSFVRFVEKQLILEPRKLVWAGDYADNEDPKIITKDIIKLAVKDYAETDVEGLKKNGMNLYTLADLTSGKITHDETIEGSKYDHEFESIAPLKYKYLINYDKKEFVNKANTPKNGDGWRMHPLPLLTCEGNGRGGGDFRGNEGKLIGRWSRDTIGVVSKKGEIPKDFTELTFDLVE